MSKSLNNELVFKWEVYVGEEKFDLSDSAFQQLLKAEKEGKRLVKIGDKVINPAFISSSKKIYKQANPIDNYVDWGVIENEKPVTELSPEELSRKDQINNEIRSTLKKIKQNESNGIPKPKIKDEQHANAVADVWEHLKSSLNAIKCPVIDLNWKLDKSITGHSQGRESHPVNYYTRKIDLGDNYDKYFWCDAGYIKCEACNKVIKHEIRIYNDYEGEVVIRNLLKN